MSNSNYYQRLMIITWCLLQLSCICHGQSVAVSSPRHSDDNLSTNGDDNSQLTVGKESDGMKSDRPMTTTENNDNNSQLTDEKGSDEVKSDQPKINFAHLSSSPIASLSDSPSVIVNKCCEKFEIYVDNYCTLVNVSGTYKKYIYSRQSTACSFIPIVVH